MKKILLALTLLFAVAPAMKAQRAMDVLDRGLVAVKTNSGVFCSWRIPGEEWYDVEYNIYRDGTLLNNKPLSVSNYLDPAGSLSSTYTVSAVVRGVEQPKCSPVQVWEKNYMVIHPKHDASLTSTYVPNDACVADVDGDGVVEILMKYDNESEISASYPRGGYNGEYSLFECLKMDGTVMWWVNCGPNMGDFQNNEQNIVGYDWDGDGKAEVVFRAADGTTIHMANGQTYTVGDPSINYRAATGGGSNWFMHAGREYLVYVNGQTGEPYQCIDYPLARLEADENPQGLLSGSAYDALVNTAWGDGYGHRSTKHFFGAPYLDGRRPSIFIARGIYTRHKMIAYDVDPATHTLVERWRWSNNEHNAWFGQGYHNYSIADVDWDGRDEIVFGSMVIDDNGMGLSTTGLGHGDSHHVGDFDPYSHGQEIFACNEDQPNNNFRDATTSKIYYRTTGGNDDGRANMGNFIDEYPGAQGVSSRDNNLIGGASHAAIIGDNKGSVSITQNFRIYWDGDLCDESFDYNSGKNTQGAIFKARQGRIALLEGSRTNNDTKGTPCLQGDIFGDWREEVIMRDGNNDIRIYTTDIPTEWRIYSLWHDPQYRNAMVWQMCGYNQTPHVSYFVGAYEGITTPPAPLTMTGRTEIANNGTIGADSNGKHIIVCETNDMNVSVADGAAPYILTVNTPTWVQGRNGSKIETATYTHTLTGGALTGEMRLVKQGDGVLVLPNKQHTYTGKTDVWAGTVRFDGTLASSPLWLNRFARLETNNGKFQGGIAMDYAATLAIGADNSASTVTTTTLALGFGAVVEIDLFTEGTAADKVVGQTLKIEKKDWTNGPEYLAPVIRFTDHKAADAATLAAGTYLIGEFANIEGSLDDLVLEGIDNVKKTLVYANGKLTLEVTAFENGTKTWAGTESNVWNIDEALNFSENGTATGFYPGDDVVFDDSATNTDVVLTTNVAPASVTFNNQTKDYNVSGSGSIIGATSVVKEGDGTVKLLTVNQYTGGTYVNGGKLVAGQLANTQGVDFGSLGAAANNLYLSNNATFEASQTATMGNKIYIRQNHAAIEIPSDVTLTLQKGISESIPGQTLTKSGAGTLNLASGNSFSKLVITDGAVNAAEGNGYISIPNTVEFIKGSLYDASDIYSYTTNKANFIVAAGNSGSLYLDARCDYTGKLTGGGTFDVYAASVRNYLKGDWSGFTGTLNARILSRGSSYDPVFYWSNSYGLPNATLAIASNCEFNAENLNVELGNLTGNGKINTTGKIVVGSLNNAFSFNGTFLGNPRLVKVGTGDWKLTRAITGLRDVLVQDGTLSLGASNVNTNVVPVELTVEGNALMRGRGTVTKLIANAGAVVEPGYYSETTPVHYGFIRTSGDATLNAGSTLSLFIRKAEGSNTHSYLEVGGVLTINGDVKIVVDDGYEPKVGDKLSLWTAAGFAGTPTSIELPQLPTGFGWDDSELCTVNGYLKVVEGSGINDIEADAVVECTVCTADGIVLGGFTCRRTEVNGRVRAMGVVPGVYLVTMVSDTTTATIKVAI